MLIIHLFGNISLSKVFLATIRDLYNRASNNYESKISRQLVTPGPSGRYICLIMEEPSGDSILVIKVAQPAFSAKLKFSVTLIARVAVIETGLSNNK